MARKYFVQKRPVGRNASATPLIFEKLIWGTLALIALIFVLSVVWRHNATDNGEEDASVSHRIIRQIPRAQLEFAEQLTPSGQQAAELEAPPTPAPAPPGAAATTESLGLNATPPARSPEPAPAGGEAGGTGPGSAVAVPSEAPSGTSAGEGAKLATVPAEAKPQETKPVESKPAAKAEPTSPSSAAEAPASTPRLTAAEAPYVVRVGAYKNQTNAQEICERVKKLGYTAQIWPHNHGQLGRLYMVELTPFESKAKALKAKEEVENQEKVKAALLVRN